MWGETWPGRESRFDFTNYNRYLGHISGGDGGSWSPFAAKSLILNAKTLDASPALCWRVVHRRHAWERSLGLALIVDSGPSPPPRKFFHEFNDKLEVPNYSR